MWLGQFAEVNFNRCLPRFYIAFASEKIGGQRAVDFMNKLLSTAIQYRAIGPATQPIDVLGHARVPSEIQEFFLDRSVCSDVGVFWVPQPL